MTPEHEKLFDRSFWRLLGLLLGLLLGVIVYREAAHAFDNNHQQLVLNGSEHAQDIARASLLMLFFEWDHALDDYGPDKGLDYKGAIATYLEGLADAYWLTRQFCMDWRSFHLVGGGEIIDLLRTYSKIHPAAFNVTIQKSVLGVLRDKFPCPQETIAK